jgi:hypothetical protein
MAETQARRATSTFDALYQRAVFHERTNLWGRRKWWLLRRNEPLWPYAEMWSATCTLAALPGQQRALAALPAFFRGLGSYHRRHREVMAGENPIAFESAAVFPHGRGGDKYYDDNTWLGLALCRHHEITGNKSAAQLSRRLLAFILEGWSNEPGWSHPGGIRWVDSDTDLSRNTCSNAPVAQLAALVGLRDKNKEMFAWSERIYAWVRESFLSDQALYIDRIAPDGQTNTQIWSYNQGTMIGAGVQLHKVTGTQSYLAQAQETAAAALAHFSLDALLGQDPAFNAVYFRNLFLLDLARHSSSYRQAAEDYGDRMWAERRDEESGLFLGGTSFLNDSAPMVELYALLAGSPPHP